MAVTTVAQLAAELNRSATALLEQLQSAGVKKASTADTLRSAGDAVETQSRQLATIPIRFRGDERRDHELERCDERDRPRPR